MVSSITINIAHHQRWFTVNQEMLLCKLNYFMFGGIIGTFLPYLHVFLEHVGLKSDEAGIIVGVQFAVSSFASPVWGYFADVSGHRKAVMVLLCVGSVITVGPMPWFVHCVEEEHLIKAVVNSTNLTSSSHPLGDHSSRAFTPHYYVLITILIVSSLFVIPLPTYMDTIGVNVINNSKSKASYGTQRIFAEIGFSTANYLGALASDFFHGPGMSHYSPVYFMVVFYSLGIIPVGMLLINQGNFSYGDSSRRSLTASFDSIPRKNVLRLLWKMFKNPDCIFFFITVFVSGVAFNTYVYFTLLLVQRVTPNTKSMVSLAFVLSSVSNMIFFPLSSKVIRYIGGPTQGMILALAAYFVRDLVMAYTSTFWVMVGIQLLHGLCFAIGWASMVEHLPKIAPKEIELTSYMLLSSFHFGVCALVANIGGGKVIQVYSSRTLFAAVGITCIAWAQLVAFYAVAKFAVKRKSMLEKAETDNKIYESSHESSEDVQSYDFLDSENTAVSGSSLDKRNSSLHHRVSFKIASSTSLSSDGSVIGDFNIATQF